MRYTKYVSQEINKSIHDANMANLSIENTMEYVRDRTGVAIGRTQLVERKRLLRIQSKKIWNEYRSDDYAYRLEHLERMAEARRAKDSAAKKIIQYENDEKKFFHWKTAVYVFLEASRYLSELTDKIPEIDAVGHEEITEETPTLSRTQGNPEAVF